MSRPKTYARKIANAVDSRRAVGKYHDEGDCRIKTARFSIGTDEVAERKLAAIQNLYENGGADSNGLWLPGLLKVAQQIAAGETPTYWERREPAEYARTVYGSRELIPALNTIDPDPELMETGILANRQYIDEKIEALRQELAQSYALQVSESKVPDKLSTSLRLSKAVAQYRKERTENYRGKYQGSVRVGKQIDEIAGLLPDCSLFNFGHDQIKAVVDHYANRPKTKISAVASKSYCENQIAELYKFCRWLEAKLGWSCPKLSAIDRRVLNKPTDALKNAIIDNRHWEQSELQIIFRNSLPLTKLIVALGLNTGSGAAELGRMRVDNFLFNSLHPYAKLIDCNLVGAWFIGTRQKQFSHSEAYLWPWVAELVKEQVAICKRHNWPYLFTEDGEPLYRDDDIYKELELPLPRTEKPEARFVTRWANALYAARKDGLIRSLSLGKLRKTLSNYLTMTKHDDLATLLLSHKTKDDLLGHYVNRPYGRLHYAIAESHDHWKLAGPKAFVL